MATYLFQMLFSWQNQGWSEQHAYSSGDTLNEGDFAEFRSICNLRGKILGNEGTIVGYRVRSISPKKRGQVVTFGNLPDTGAPIVGTGGNGDSPSVTLDIGWKSAGSQNQTQTFLRGIPDDEVIQGGVPNPGTYNPPGFTSAVFRANLQAYLNNLTPTANTIWGWYGSSRAHKASVITVAQNVNDTLSVTFDKPIFVTGAPPGVAITPPAQVNVRFSGGQRGQPLNRTHPVNVMSTTLAITVRPLGLLAPPSTLTGTYNEYGFNAYSEFQLRHVGTRRVGRQFFVLAGRQRDR